MTTISDIAKATGMARTTVAEILRHKPGYNEQTRKRVLQAAKRLNYQPNYLSKALAGGKSMTLGLVMASIDTPIASFKVIALEARAREHGYLTYLAGWGNHQPTQICQYLRDMLSRRVDGLIVYRMDPLPADAQKLLAQSQIPVAYLDWAPPRARDHVRINRQKGINQLIKHLAEQGHRRVAFLCQTYNRQVPSHKGEKYQRACRKYGLTLLFNDQWSLGDQPDNLQVMHQRLKHNLALKNAPTAIVADNDQMAGLAIHCLQNMNVKVPGDISVAGFDDLPLALIPKPALTTIRQPRDEPGQAVVDLLLERIRTPNRAPDTQTFDCQLVLRDSTGSAPT